MISEAPYLGFLGYSGYYGDELAALDDGTGRHDLLVSEPAYYDDVHVVDGLTGQKQATLSNTPFGSNADFGRGIDGVPDIDGDGVEDFAVGAPGGPGGGPGGGAVFLYRRVLGGTPQLWATLSAPGPELYEFGAAVAGLEDVDGDGFGDLVVGQPGAQYSSILYPGYAYLYSGASGTLLHTFSLSGGPASAIGFGKSVASLPDVDGDGLEDIAVGGGSGSSGPGGSGVVHVYSSASGGLIRAIPSPYSAGGGSWARELAGVEDLNGDGLGELLVGAPGNNRAPVFSCVDGVLIKTLMPPSTQVGMQFGFAVDASGDVDGDGTPDLLVGAPYERYQSQYDKGRVYLYSGASGMLLRAYERPADFLPGFDFHEYFGRSVLITPDSNGDGRADVVIGAPGMNIPDTGNGATFSFFCLDEQAASVDVRPGAPPNPDVFASQAPPLIGAVWQAEIDHASFVPGSLLDVGIFSTAPANQPIPGGTLLVDLGQLLFTKLAQPGSGPIEVGIPSDCALVGIGVSVQGASWDGLQLVGTNALDLVIGSF